MLYYISLSSSIEMIIIIVLWFWMIKIAVFYRYGWIFRFYDVLNKPKLELMLTSDAGFDAFMLYQSNEISS